MAFLSALQKLVISTVGEAGVHLHWLPTSLQRLTVDGGPGRVKVEASDEHEGSVGHVRAPPEPGH